MMKLGKLSILLIAVCIGTGLLGGCNKAPAKSGTEAPAAADTNTDIIPGDKNNPIDADQLYADMSLSGTVAEFTSDGCSVIPITTEDVGDGFLAYQVIPGNENKEKNVTVTYNNDCVFQLAAIDVETGLAVLSDAAKEDVKKQTTLMLYGDYQDTYHLNVSMVVIQRLEGVSE